MHFFSFFLVLPIFHREIEINGTYEKYMDALGTGDMYSYSRHLHKVPNVNYYQNLVKMNKKFAALQFLLYYFLNFFFFNTMILILFCRKKEKKRKKKRNLLD